MAGVTNNLYPPILPTYQPAFALNTSSTTEPTICKIYFSLSSYNSPTDIKSIQITLCNQNTNATVLNTFTGIKIIDGSLIKVDEKRTSVDKYYIELSSSDLVRGFEINQYYKLQMRFSKVAFPVGVREDAWLAANTANFSEWSTICLIRAISRPFLSFTNFSNQEGAMTVSQTVLALAGTLSFEDDDETETMKSYRAYLYQGVGDSKKLVADSGLIYSNSYSNVNEINYTFKHMLEDGMTYTLIINVLTRNLYETTFEKTFTVIQNTLDKLLATVTCEPEEEIGCIKVNIKITSPKNYTGYIQFRRASSRDNFETWEDIHMLAINNTALDYTWYDYTIESGVWYKYCAQKIDTRGGRGIAVIVNKPAMTLFEDMFLCADQKQLRLKYNPQVTSFKHNISESKTDTIGSQYPFIKRNGAIDYRQFSISGMITLHTDYLESFVTKEEIYGNEDILRLYNQYNSEHKIDDYNDYVFEREFREKVIEFLYADNVKLLRTTTEGNVLVKLMDISLTPEQVLGRMLYSFSATAYEIDDCTVDNMNLYNINSDIIKINLHDDKDIDYQLAEKESKIGQIMDTFAANQELVSTILTKKYGYFGSNNKYKVKIEKLSSLRLEFNMKPYLIKNMDDGSLMPLGSKEKPTKNTILGYIVYINDEAIYVNPAGIYDLNDEVTEVTSIKFPVDTFATLDYTVNLIIDDTYKPDILYYTEKLGQVWGVFNYEDSVFQTIWRKYYRANSRYYQKLIAVGGVKIEANPGTVVWMKDSSSFEMKRFVIDKTCQLDVYHDDIVIEGLYFGGIHLDEANPIESQREIAPVNKFIETGIEIESLDDIEHPVVNGVYTFNTFNYGAVLEELSPVTGGAEEEDVIHIPADEMYALLVEKILRESKRFIYYNDKWCIFTKNNDILCSVDAIVNYYCEVMKGVYAS